MIDTLVIVVYDRVANISKWMQILEQCIGLPKKIVIIHTGEGDIEHMAASSFITYIKRPNIGFDIGCFQDVCKGRLAGFPEWNELLWCTDDTFPMDPEFIKHFNLQDGEGVRCMELSPYVRPHIRTTGFSIRKETAQQLIFPADPVRTKQECFLFEHRDRFNTIHDQVKRMGLSVVMVADRTVSPMWDTGYHRKLDRYKEFNEQWHFTELEDKIEPDKVVIICPLYNNSPETLIASLRAQTYTNWFLMLVHDGPVQDIIYNKELSDYLDALNDDRIVMTCTKENVGFWGHSIRRDYLNDTVSKFVMITNGDNYYSPPFIDLAVKALQNNTRAVAAYSAMMVHSYKAHGVIQCRVIRGYLDCGGVLLRTDKAQSSGWHDVEHHSADWFFFERLAAMFGADNFIKIEGCHFIHN